MNWIKYILIDQKLRSVSVQQIPVRPTASGQALERQIHHTPEIHKEGLRYLCCGLSVNLLGD